MGLPQIQITFTSKGSNAIQRSARGVVALILRDDTDPENIRSVYSSVADLDYMKWSEKSAAYIKLAYLGGPSKVVIIRMPGTPVEGDINDALKKLKDLRWNYLTIPGLKENEKTFVTAWIKEQREKYHKTFKAVLPNCAADHEGIINLTTDNITILEGDAKVRYSCIEYCTRIAGLLSGLSLERSSTYFVLEEIIAADTPDDPDERIDKGEFIIVFDTDRFLVGRGVNSLTSFTAKKGKDLSKIKIIEGMDLYRDDIRETFKNHYVGKVINDYNNKQALVAAINSYHRALEGDVLDAAFENKAEISLDAQRNYMQGQNIDTEEMSELQIRQGNTGSQVFLLANIKFVDAMEDLDLAVNM